MVLNGVGVELIPLGIDTIPTRRVYALLKISTRWCPLIETHRPPSPEQNTIKLSSVELMTTL